MADDDDDVLQIAVQDPWNHPFSAQLFTDMFLMRTEMMFLQRAGRGLFRTYVAILPSKAVPDAFAMAAIVPFWEMAPEDRVVDAVKVYLAESSAIAVASAEVHERELRTVIEVYRQPRRAFTAQIRTEESPPGLFPWQPALVKASISMLPAVWENVQ